jgi:hypothetical protein
MKDVHERGSLELDEKAIVVTSSILIGDEGMLMGVYDVGETLSLMYGS